MNYPGPLLPHEKQKERCMLPEKFKDRMKRLLKEDYGAFIEAMTENEPVRAFRINRIKVKSAEMITEALGDKRVPYEPSGFILNGGIQIGKDALHHAGAVYVQDPGAMAALSAVDIPWGARVLDLCAAPGGKSSKLAEAIGENGFLVSNEYVPKRAKLLVGNFERLGVKNAIVTSLDTSEVQKLFDGVFDLVVADVPCSGEGMFRKNSEAISEWSEENVTACKRRQKEILENAAALVAPGGTLLYSTCTFSVEENEENVLEFIEKHGDFTLVPVHERLLPHTAPAIDVSGRHPEIQTAARRFYPHICKGEGQFVAVMKRKAHSTEPRGFLYKDCTLPPSREQARIAEEFFASNLVERPRGRVVKYGENLVLISHGYPIPPKSVFLSGVLVGEIRGNILFPSHQFFSAYGELFKNKLDIKPGDPMLEKYLRGEEIPTNGSLAGWCAVTTDGIPLGGGKASGGRLKNHYPKGLRNKD